MNIIIRAARPADAQTLSEIGSATFALACPPNTLRADLDSYILSEMAPARFLEHMACPARSLFVAEIDGSSIGYLMLCREGCPDAIAAHNPFELRRIYVLADFHGSGAAGILMNKVLRLAVAGKHDVVWLGVSKHNGRAIAFYRKHGFTVVGEQAFMVGNDAHEDFVMARTLAKHSRILPGNEEG
jgi:diamine N-acetyltransferase